MGEVKEVEEGIQRVRGEEGCVGRRCKGTSTTAIAPRLLNPRLSTLLGKCICMDEPM